MGYKSSVAIIGATTTLGNVLVKSMASDYRLLLVDINERKLKILRAELQNLSSNTEVELSYSCKDACWEADVIILAVACDEQASIALSLKEVATCKTIINITTSETRFYELQHILPYSNLVNVLVLGKTYSILHQLGNNECKNKEAIETVYHMLNTSGFIYNTKNIDLE